MLTFKDRRRIIQSLITSTLVLLGFLWLLLKPSKSPIPPPPVVSVMVDRVTQQDLVVSQRALGTVIPRYTVTVQPQVDGKLLHVFFKEGQEVEAGQMLAQIDPRPYEAALKQAQGILERDQALLHNAERDLHRYQNLKKQDSIALQTHDTQETLVRQYQGMVHSDQGQLLAAQTQLEFTRIIAPLSGRIGLRLVDPGNVVRASMSQGLCVITQTSPITVLFTLPQDQLSCFLPFLTEHQNMVVEAWNSDMTSLLEVGELESIDNQIDVTTGTFKLKALFQNTEKRLFPNQFVNVRILLETLPQVTTIPTSAIQRGVQGTFVYRLTPQGTVSVTPVQIGAVDGFKAQVISGLQRDDQVVMDGADKLKDGASVKVSPSSSQAVSTP